VGLTRQRQIRVERLGDALVSTPFVGTAIALLTWPIASPVPSAGPDPSWVAGLYMALGNGLQFGTEFVFSYGPLGFLQQPALYDSGLWIVAFLYRALIYVLLSTALLWAARRAMPLLLAAALVYAMLVAGYLEGGVVLLTLVVCVSALSDRPPARAAYLVALAGGILAAIELLGKLNFGIAIFALCLITLLGLPERRRYVSLFAAALLSALLVLWLLTGQAVANLPEFASNSLQVLSGYSGAMGTNVTDIGWQRPYAVAAIALLVAAAMASTRRDPAPRRISTIALFAVFGFLTFKQSFVRQGLGNASDFFPLMLGAALGLLWRLPVRLPRLPPHAAALALALPLAVLAVATLPRPSLWAALDPADHVEYLRQDIRTLASASERRELAAEGRKSLISRYRVGPGTLSLLHGRKVDVEPWEIAAAWAYGLDWQPLPAIQGYQAYTPELDRLNADALSGPSAPTAILRQNTRAFEGAFDESIDQRYIAWDPPAAAREMLCHYRAIRTTRDWQVLYPTAERCGPPRRIGRVHTETGRAIRVPPPAPGTIVFAKVKGLGIGGFEQLRTVLYRARQRTATVNGTKTWRVVPETATDGLILRSDRRIDFPGPFGLAPQAGRISFDVAGDGDRPIEVSFYMQPVRPAPADRQRGSADVFVDAEHR
jgi:hypothetical protein